MPVYTVDGLLIFSLLLGVLFIWRIGKFGQSDLRFGDVFREDIVDVVVLLLLLGLNFLLPACFEDLLELGLLFLAELVGILEKFNELFFS